MEKLLSNLKLDIKNENIISFTIFGSYNTKYWCKERSDIDILVLMKIDDYNVEFEIEDQYREIFTQYFNHNDIHFTFITLKSFDTVFADIYIDFTDKIIFDIEKHYDYLMYINKFNRVNDNLIQLVRKDWESKYGVL